MENILVIGFRITLEIVTVLWGALLFIRVLDQTGKTQSLNHWLKKFHPDPDFQVFLLSRGWVSVLEGVSGFGSPPALIAPILIRMGVSRELAMILPLYGNVVTVPFGAMATPIILGFPKFNWEVFAIQIAWTSVFLGLITFAGVWILIRGARLPRHSSEWLWLVRGYGGSVIGMIFGGYFAPHWAATLSGLGTLLFWIPWSRVREILDLKILFLIEMTAILFLGQVLMKDINILGFRLTNPGIWVATASTWVAYRSGKRLGFLLQILRETLVKLKKPFIVTLSMTLFILFLTDWMQTHIAYFSIGNITSLWLGFIAPALAGTSTLGNLWVSSAFLTPAQNTQAAWVAIGSGFGTLISFQILTSVATTVGLKRIPVSVWKKSLTFGLVSLCLISVGLVLSQAW